MQRNTVTTRLVVHASHVLQETVGVLSDPERGVVVFDSGHNNSRLSLLRTWEAILRLGLVSIPPELVSMTNTAMMFGIHW